MVEFLGKQYKRDNKSIVALKILRDFKCQICETSMLKKDAPIVIITPIFKTYENKIIPLNINNIVDKYGFEILEKFDYMPPNSKILRVINIIKRKL